jgi:hypothetical protein
MRGSDLPRRAERRISEDYTHRAAREFNHGLLSDGVREDVLQDEQLADLEDAIATAEDARDRRRGGLDDTSEDHGARVAAAMNDLQAVVRQRIMELCAERAHAALEAGDQWVADGVDAADVAAAQHEARQWLHAHPDVCQRVFDEREPAVLDNEGPEVTA